MTHMNPIDFGKHRGPVTGSCFIPGEHRILTSGYDSAVGVFDFDDNTVKILGYHNHLANAVSVSADGGLAASCSSDYTIGIWNLRDYSPVSLLKGHEDDVESFDFVSETIGVSASRDHTLIIWDIPSGQILRRLRGHQKDVLAAACHAGNIYSAGDDMTLRKWDLDTGDLLQTWGPFDNETDTVAVDPVHGFAVLGCDDGCIRVFDIEQEAMVQVIEAHQSGIKKVAISPANGDILSAAYDQRLLVWDPETFQLKTEMQYIPGTWERSIAWSADGKMISAGTFDGTVLVWDTLTGQLSHRLGGQGSSGNACFNDVAATADNVFTTVSDDGILRLGEFSQPDPRWIQAVEPASGRMLMNAVTLDTESQLVVGGAHNRKLHIYDLGDGCLSNEREVALNEGPVNSVRISRSPTAKGQIFAACYSGAIVKVDASGTVLDKIRVHDGAVKALRLHPTKPVGLSCGADGILVSWNYDGDMLREYKAHDAIINDLDLNPAGTMVASVSRDFSLKVHDIETGKRLHTLMIGNKSLKSVCFWDDDTVVIGDYWGGMIKVDLQQQRYERYEVARNGLSAITHMGSHVLGVSYDGIALMMRPDDMKVIATLRAMDQRLDDERIVKLWRQEAWSK